ncbi:MAG: exodeoxyribonuclease VII small subunit [Clostridia bacterium]|nr:exodeoxyribonuclease VII small subunit [Clostridia bacterium]
MPEKMEITFEKALESLEGIINSLENESISLDKSLELFKEGVGLIKICNERLDNADAVVKQLANVNGEIVEIDFSSEDNDEN